MKFGFLCLRNFVIFCRSCDLTRREHPELPGRSLTGAAPPICHGENERPNDKMANVNTTSRAPVARTGDGSDFVVYCIISNPSINTSFIHLDSST